MGSVISDNMPFFFHTLTELRLILNIKLAQENPRKNLQPPYLNATNDQMNNQRNFKKQKDNYLLAEDVYTVTMDRYREGIASMTEVLQDEMQMSEAQNNYISAHYNYRVTTLLLLKLTGQIDTLIKYQVNQIIIIWKQ